MVHAGHPQDQAVAAAMRIARKPRASGGPVYEIYNRQTKQVVGQANSVLAARRARDRHDLKYGASVHMYRPAPGQEDVADQQMKERLGRKHGGKVHSGPINSAVAGRTDHLPMHVPSGAYVIPADIISAMGEGNSLAGFKVAKSIFSAPFYGSGDQPYTSDELPYGGDEPHKARGGEATVPIVAAGGEYVIHPRDVQWLGKGSLDDGHRILDEFVKGFRAKTIKTLKSLPGPKKD